MSNTASPSANDWSPKLDSQLAGQLENISLTEDPFYDKFADDTGIDKSEWGLGPPVELAPANKSYTVLNSMDQQDLETHYLLQGNDNGFLYHGHVKTVKWEMIQSIKGDGQEFASLELEAVFAHQLFPGYLPSMRKFTGSTEAKDVFMKEQTYLKRSKYEDSSHADCTLREVLRGEEISKKPHKHLARYLGVETKVIGGVERVVRIAYQRYSMDLETFMLEKRLNLDNRATLMQGMRDGIKHLHEQDLVHCDLRPANVFVTFKKEEGKSVVEEVVVGDFDASLKVGEPVWKRACGKWFPPHLEDKWGAPAEFSFDDYSLGIMETEFGNYLKENGLEEYDWGDNPVAFPPTEAPEVPDGFSYK
jgi:hypothetical protein